MNIHLGNDLTRCFALLCLLPFSSSDATVPRKGGPVHDSLLLNAFSPMVPKRMVFTDGRYNQSNYANNANSDAFGEFRPQLAR